VNRKLEKWRNALESKGFRISRAKTEYMACNYSMDKSINEGRVTLENQELPQCSSFKYLGSVVHNEGNIEDDVNHRIKAGWTK
ncbi:hypothetical protein, partial [Escherichia coli]|uniref:hypothetical protein n=1 Tax=Escherichia coli TaxID=562 RepID=UPI003F459331